MILEAPADRMLDYTQIFLDEQNQMAEAKKNFIQDSMEVIQKFKNDLQSIDVKKRRELEKKVKAQEEAEEEAMLAQMNNL
jgi:4-diphosphocytidyl-2C-methyl-D-erythritol kinase